MARQVKEHREIIENKGEYDYCFTYDKNDILLEKCKLYKNNIIVRVKCKYCGSYVDLYLQSYKDRGSKSRCCCHNYENSLQKIFDDYNIKKEDIWSSKNKRNPKYIWKSSKEDIWLKCIKNKNHEDYKTNPNHFLRSLKTNNFGCPKCASKIIDYRDSFGYKNKSIIKYIIYNEKMEEINDEFFYKITENNLNKFYYKCLFCGELSKSPHDLKYITRNNCLCEKHKDRTSFPERVMCSILDYLNIEYKMHIRFKWSDNKEYDFYIPHLKLLIEMDGRLGHGDKSIDKKDIRRSQFIDDMKDLMANNNGLNIIRIDCKFRNESKKFDYIKNNILNSELSEIFNIKNIKWDVIKKMSQSPIKINIIKDFNNGVKIECLIDKYGLSKGVIQNYLKEANLDGLCNYDGKKDYYNALREKDRYLLKLLNGEEIYFKTLEDLCNTINCTVAFLEKYFLKDMYIDFEKVLLDCNGKGSYQTKKVINNIDNKYDKSILIKL